jgi:hypothetical protein
MLFLRGKSSRAKLAKLPGKPRYVDVPRCFRPIVTAISRIKLLRKLRRSAQFFPLGGSWELSVQDLRFVQHLTLPMNYSAVMDIYTELWELNNHCGGYARRRRLNC